MSERSRGPHEALVEKLLGKGDVGSATFVGVEKRSADLQGTCGPVERGRTFVRQVRSHGRRSGGRRRRTLTFARTHGQLRDRALEYFGGQCVLVPGTKHVEGEEGKGWTAIDGTLASDAPREFLERRWFALR